MGSKFKIGILAGVISNRDSVVRKKLLHVTSSLKIGGAEALLCDLIRGLGDKEFEHHVIYFHPGSHVQQLRTMGVPLYHVQGFLGYYDPVFFIRLFWLIKKLRPDVIHSLLWAANVSSRVVARLCSIPNVSVYHLSTVQDGWFRNMLDGATRKLSNKLIAVSSETAHSIGMSDAYLSAGKLVVIENGINIQEVRSRGKKQAISRSSLGFAQDAFIIGSVGRFCAQKNYPLLLESFSLVAKQNQKARLMIVGVGSDEHALRVRAQMLGISDKVTFIVGKSAYGYFPLFDCFVLSSDKEGISIALLEAMSFGIPCVVTDERGMHPVLATEKTGIIVERRNVVALAKAVDRLIENRTLASQLGMAGKRKVEQSFSSERMIKEYRELFRSISM